MGKLRQLSYLVLGSLLLIAMTYLIVIMFMALALLTLEARYDTLSAGQTVEEADKIMGGLFLAREIRWDNIPKIYTGHYVERPGSSVREYTFFGIGDLSIVVVYDREGLLYLTIPVYE